MLEFLQTLNWAAVLQIIVIDILLGGDNAVVIALACRNLQSRQRLQGILWGTVGAVAVRIALIAFALSLLEIPFLKLAGALLLLWIGIKLLIPEHDTHDSVKSSTSVLNAVKTILMADLVMSLDNVIAIAGAAQNAHVDHQIGLVAFGLVISVPIIVWGSTLVLKLIDHYPIIVTLGAGLLGWIAGGMLITDAFLLRHLGPPASLPKLAVEGLCALVVVGIGRYIARRRGRSARARSGQVAGK